MWIVLHLLLLLQRGACTGAQNFSTLTVGPGQNVSLTCPRQENLDIEYFFWIRLVSGTFPQVLAATPSYDEGYIYYGQLNIGNRITAKKEAGTFDLHIRQVKKNDTAIYYCFKTALSNFGFLNGTFLQVTEPEPSVSVVPEVQPGQPVKFRCSVLSQLGNEICRDGHKLHWFRTGPDNDHPSFVYTHDECEKVKDNSTRKCIHTLSKNVSSSDPESYFCAVTACGRIFMGNPIKVNDEERYPIDAYVVLLRTLSVILALSLLIIAFLISVIMENKRERRRRSN